MSSWSNCHNCKRDMMGGTCTIPSGNGTSYWKRHSEVGTWTPVPCPEGMVCDAEFLVCDYYDPKSGVDVVKERLKTPYYKICRGIDSVKDFMRFNLIGKLKYGFDPRDSWDLGHATAKFMLPRLRKYIDDEPQGTPSVLSSVEFVTENKLEPYFSCELDGPEFKALADGDDSTIQEVAWIKILEAIHYSMDGMVHDCEGEFDNSTTNKHGEFELDMEKQETMTDRITEGHRLLGIFFRNLWD